MVEEFSEGMCGAGGSDDPESPSRQVVHRPIAQVEQVRPDVSESEAQVHHAGTILVLAAFLAFTLN